MLIISRIGLLCYLSKWGTVYISFIVYGGGTNNFKYYKVSVLAKKWNHLWCYLIVFSVLF